MGRNLFWSVAVALCLAVPSVVQAGGHGGGGGAHVVVVGSYGRSIPLGPWLSYPVDIVDSPPESMSGALTPGAVIGVYKVRARSAVVLTAPVKATLSAIPAGKVLGRYTYKVGEKTEAVWCDDEKRGLVGPWVACFADDGGSGSFTRMIMAFDNNRADPSGVGVLQLGAVSLIAPAAYRAAQPEELPVTQIGYRLCGGDGRKTPYRFTSVILRGADGWIGASANCPFGDWPTTDVKDVETVDSLTLHITRTGAAISFTADSTLAPGPLADFAVNGPVRALSSPDPADARKAEARAAQALVLTGLAQVQTTGTAQAGAVIASAPVIHGVTGVLRNPIVSEGLFGERSLPAGQYVFGVPVKTSDGVEEITWCAPRPDKAGQIVTNCFPRRGAVNIWQDTKESLMPTGVVSLIGREVSDLNVERKTVPFTSAMTLTYSFSRWYGFRIGTSRIMVAEVKVAIETGGVSYPVGVLTLSPAKDGAYRFAVQNSLITLSATNKAGGAVTPPVSLTRKAEFDTFFDTVETTRAEIKATAPTVVNNFAMLNGMVSMELAPQKIPPPAPPPPAGQAPALAP